MHCLRPVSKRQLSFLSKLLQWHTQQQIVTSVLMLRLVVRPRPCIGRKQRHARTSWAELNSLRPPTDRHTNGAKFTYPGGMEGWLDLSSLIAARPGIELTTAGLGTAYYQYKMIIKYYRTPCKMQLFKRWHECSTGIRYVAALKLSHSNVIGHRY